jgi:hypothetical protein
MQLLFLCARLFVVTISVFFVASGNGVPGGAIKKFQRA